MILTDSERSIMNDTETGVITPKNEPATGPQKVDQLIPTIKVTPAQKKKNDKAFKALAKEGAKKIEELHSTEVTPQKKAEDLSKIIDAFLIGNKTADKLKPEQIMLCKQTALAFGLNPLKREIHFVPREVKKKNPETGYWEKSGEYEVSIVIGYEVYIKRAEATGKLNGWGVRFEKDGVDTKAIITIHKKGWENPFEHEVYLSEVRQQSPIWDKMPKFMLRKVAIGQGFRLAFPEEMGGLPYLPEELGIDSVEEKNVLPSKKPIEELTGTVVQPSTTNTQQTSSSNAPITMQQCALIVSLLGRKGKEQQPILDFFKVEKISKLNYSQGEHVINKLNSYEDIKKEEAPLNTDNAQQLEMRVQNKSV